MTAALAHLDPEAVLVEVEILEPCTVTDVGRALCPPACRWDHRGTVRNRLDALVATGALIVDRDHRPARYALNQLGSG